MKFGRPGCLRPCKSFFGKQSETEGPGEGFVVGDVGDFRDPGGRVQEMTRRRNERRKLVAGDREVRGGIRGQIGI